MEEPTFKWERYFILTIVILFLILSFALFYRLFISAPSNFQVGKYIEVKSGWSIDEAGRFFQEHNIIRSSLMFKILAPVVGKSGSIIAGEFIFDKPANLFGVIESVTDTGYQGRAVKVTIPEGYTNKDIAGVLADKLPEFDGSVFLKRALAKEGSLFPDTYIFPITYTEDKIINRMFDNFQTKIADIKPDIIASKRTRNEIIIMASILEKEARTLETKKKIAGILWKRLDAGKLLQVDASFMYLLNKQSSELTGEDLNMDSPYNTYKYKGLPPGAISNPGLESLKAALYPEESKYWFYLSDKEGNMHYAVTFDEHKRNKVLYLK